VETAPKKTAPSATRIVRRVHMYLALLLAPWMVMYALSTMAMNHRRLFSGSGGPPPMQVERTLTYTSALPAEALPREVARRILADLGLEGAHTVQAPRGGGAITIHRADPVTPRRITFVPSSGGLTIEKQPFQMPAFLERMHRRRGFQSGYWAQNAWAASVDLAILAILFWAASGIWIWWTLKRTRAAGAVCACAGLALFAFFLLTS